MPCQFRSIALSIAATAAVTPILASFASCFCPAVTGNGFRFSFRCCSHSPQAVWNSMRPCRTSGKCSNQSSKDNPTEGRTFFFSASTLPLYAAPSPVNPVVNSRLTLWLGGGLTPRLTLSSGLVALRIRWPFTISLATYPSFLRCVSMFASVASVVSITSARCLFDAVHPVWSSSSHLISASKHFSVHGMLRAHQIRLGIQMPLNLYCPGLRGGKLSRSS